MESMIAGRTYPRVYRVSRRQPQHEFLIDAVRRAGAEVLYMSEPNRAPVYVGMQLADGTRLGVLSYLFTCTQRVITGRPPDEHRLQVRYESERTWREDHPLGRDIAGVDTTIVLGVHAEAGIFIGLDPARYDPLPMGISVEFKQDDVDSSRSAGWHVWERERRPGRRRGMERVGEGLETLVGFRPERLATYVGFEQRATALHLDSPLRFKAAEVLAAESPQSPQSVSTHRLEEEFSLSSQDILDIIASRTRLGVAVGGGVAEHHLLRVFRADGAISQVELIDRDGEPDFSIVLGDGRRILVECKNVSPRLFADGTPRVEVQKTRSQRDDPAGRFYRPEQFDVVAACLFAVTGRWEFRYKSTFAMDRHQTYPDRLAVMHHVDDTWSDDLLTALAYRMD